MTRILADLPDEDIQKLDALALRKERSRASLVREAIHDFLARSSDDRSWIDKGFGLWADRDDIPDGLDYQRNIRQDRRPYDEL